MNIIDRLRNRLMKSYQLELFMIIQSSNDKIDINLDDRYSFRNFREDDEKEILDLMKINNFDILNNSALIKEMSLCIPEGNFVIIHKSTKKIVGIFMARHNHDGKHINSGRIDWLAVHPKHRGNGLGSSLTALTVNSLINKGYKTIFVGTNDTMLAAIKIYLYIGFIPNLFNSEMFIRWEKLYKTLNLPYFQDEWLKEKNKNGILNYLTKK